MIILYWIAAFSMSILAAFFTSLVIVFLMDMLRGDILDQSVNRFWDWCVNGMITLTYLAIPFYTHEDDSLSAKIKSWEDLWLCLHQLARVEIKWFICIVVFWFCIIALVHRARSS